MHVLCCKLKVETRVAFVSSDHVVWEYLEQLVSQSAESRKEGRTTGKKVSQFKVISTHAYSTQAFWENLFGSFSTRFSTVADKRRAETQEANE